MNGQQVKADLEAEASSLEELATNIEEESDDNDVESQSIVLTLRDLAAKTRGMKEHMGSEIIAGTVNSTLLEMKEESLADTKAEFAALLKAAVQVGSFATNILNDIGTFEQKLNKLGDFVGTKLSPWLEKRDMKVASKLAKVLGRGISKTGQFIAPFEQKLAKKLEPIKNNKIFQQTRRVLNAADAAISISAVAKNVFKGYKAVKNLPLKGKNFMEIVNTGLEFTKRGVALLKELSALKKAGKAVVNVLKGIWGLGSAIKQGFEAIIGKGYDTKSDRYPIRRNLNSRVKMLRGSE